MASFGFDLVHPKDMSQFECDYPIGDILNKNVVLGLGTIYRAWHLFVPAPKMGRREYPAKICIRYHPPTNTTVFILNGEVKFKYHPEKHDGEFDIIFRLYDNTFTIKGKNKYSYPSCEFTLYLEKTEIKDIRNSSNIALIRNPIKSVTIPSYRFISNNKKSYVVYQIHCQIENNEKIMVEKRYSEFVILDQVIRGHLTNHIRVTLPNLPQKIFNPFVDQFEVKFLNNRKFSLQAYLVFLLNNDKVRNIL